MIARLLNRALIPSLLVSLLLSACGDGELVELDFGRIREEVCGDRVLTFREQCDDGNQESGDGCSSDCLIEPDYSGGEIAGEIAGEYITEGAGEDAGEYVGSTAGEVAGVTAGERADEPAGDIPVGEAGEVVGEIAGEITSEYAGEYAGEDAGGDVIENAGEDTGEDAGEDTGGLVGLLCGDGVIGLGEQCDDGNQESGDGCSSACQLEGAQCQDDHLEPNQDVSGATLISWDSPEVSIEAMLCEADLDVYALNGCSGGILDVSLIFDVFSADLDLRLTDHDGRLLNSSALAQSHETLNQTLWDDQPVFIEVYGYLDVEESPYTLTASLRGCGGVREDCSLAGDEDGNGLADCDDPSCVNSPLCTAQAENCFIIGDEDGNGLADCDDPVCFGSPACQTTGPAACRPENILVAADYGVYQGDTYGAPAEERGICVGSGNEQVYLFMAPQSGEVCVDTIGSGYDTGLYVRSACGDSNAELACDDDSGGALQSEVSFSAIAGQSYYLFVDGFSGAGDYTLSISAGACGAVPQREDCVLFGDEDGNGLADCDDPACFGTPACQVTGPIACRPENILIADDYGVYQGDTYGAPTEERGLCVGSGNEQVYLFTAPQSGEVCVNTFGSSYDTGLHVRSTCGDSNAELACNDDSGSGVQSEVSFNAIAGQNYYLFVDGFSGAGDYTLSISAGACGAFPQREDCTLFGDEDGNGLADCDDPVCFGTPACQATGPIACRPENILVAGGYGTYQGDTYGAPAEERGVCVGSGNEQVYLFVAPQSGEVCVDTFGSGYDTGLYVRSACGDINAELACNDDAGGTLESEVSFSAIAGQSYYLFVDGFGGAGNYTLSINAGSCGF